MKTVVVKYKLVHKDKQGSVTGGTITSRAIQVTKNPPTESEVNSKLKHLMPDKEFIILDVN